MKRRALALIVALLGYVVQPPQPVRGAPALPSSYTYVFACDELEPGRVSVVLHNLEKKLQSVGGVAVVPSPGLNDAQRKKLFQKGGEVLDVILRANGDDRVLTLNVDSLLHVAKPYKVMTVKTSVSSQDVVGLPINLDRIARKVREHHQACHVDGACP